MLLPPSYIASSSLLVVSLPLSPSTRNGRLPFSQQPLSLSLLSFFKNSLIFLPLTSVTSVSLLSLSFLPKLPSHPLSSFCCSFPPTHCPPLLLPPSLQHHVSPMLSPETGRILIKCVSCNSMVVRVLPDGERVNKPCSTPHLPLPPLSLHPPSVLRATMRTCGEGRSKTSL